MNALRGAQAKFFLRFARGWFLLRHRWCRAQPDQALSKQASHFGHSGLRAHADGIKWVYWGHGEQSFIKNHLMQVC